MHRLKAFDPSLGNLLEIIPSHHAQNEYAAVFPMGEFGRELSEDNLIQWADCTLIFLSDVSRFNSDGPGNMVFNPTGSSSFVFETPILQISSAVGPSQWVSTPPSVFLVRTYTSSSLLRLECSKVTRELDITRSEAGDIPIADSKILASGPDIVVVNRSGKVYKCNTYHGGKAMYAIAATSAALSDPLSILGRLEPTKRATTITFGSLVSPDAAMNVFLRHVKLSSILT